MYCVVLQVCYVVTCIDECVISKRFVGLDYMDYLLEQFVAVVKRTSINCSYTISNRLLTKAHLPT